MAVGHPLLPPVHENPLTVADALSSKPSRNAGGRASASKNGGKAKSPAANYAKLGELLGHSFAKPALLTEALTHRSATGANGPYRYGYERLEFLGDRVLGLVIADLLLERFPTESEGALAGRFNALVQGETLADVAAEIDLGAHLIMAPGEEQAGGRENKSILSDVCESVIAALYLDGGLPAAQQFIRRYWTPMLIHAKRPKRDGKTRLQEWAQSRALPLPDYTTLSREGPPHNPIFAVRVKVLGAGEAEGQGSSKRMAEQAAADALLAHLDPTGLSQ
ncbi:MAG TPA: ribonuclease III [Alphaproteobacteria bacterium]|nr:ribonuclease III [Alphaproteobacteria bacterium]